MENVEAVAQKILRLRSAGMGHLIVQGTRDSESSEKSGADWSVGGRGTSEPGRHPRACTARPYAFSQWRTVDLVTSFGVAHMCVRVNTQPAIYEIEKKGRTKLKNKEELTQHSRVCECLKCVSRVSTIALSVISPAE